MATQPPVIEEQSTDTKPATKSKIVSDHEGKDDTVAQTQRTPFRQVLRELDWRLVTLVGIGLGVPWVLLLTSSPTLMLFASLIPVFAGLIVGRRIQQHVIWHGAMLSLIATIAAFITAGVMLALVGLTPLLLQTLTLIPMSLLPFPLFAVWLSSRSEQRNRAAREVVQRRGGRLDKPGRVRDINDLRALSLLQLGGYVADLFRKHGFTINDYRIEKDKDRIDFIVAHEGTPWLMRVTTADKVKPGVPQELTQRMKAEGFEKGVVITSMDFQEPAVRWAKNKPVALIDGETLLTMDD